MTQKEQDPNWIQQIQVKLDSLNLEQDSEDKCVCIHTADKQSSVDFLSLLFGCSIEQLSENGSILFHWNNLLFYFADIPQQPCCDDRVIWNLVFSDFFDNGESDYKKQIWISIKQRVDLPEDLPVFYFPKEESPIWDESALALMEWTLDQFLHNSSTQAFHPLDFWENKKDIVRKKIIPVYTGISAGIAAVPIPFSDAMLLIPCQTTLGLHILKVYDLESISPVVSSLISSTIISQLARSTAANLIKMIPVVGTVTGTLINSGIASSFTWVLGMALSEIAFSFKKARLEGKEPDLEEFFSQLNLRNIMRGIDPSDYDEIY